MVKKIVHWGGIVFAAVIQGFHKTEQKLDTDMPAIDAMLQEGASIAQFLPGPIGPMVATSLNFGVELLGAADKMLHYTDDEYQAIKAQVQAAVPSGSGYGVVIIPQQLEASVQDFLTKIKTEADAVKAAALAITGKDGAPAAAKASA